MKVKMYRPVTIEFSSLRNGLGSGLGVIFDVDETVKRKVRRVIVDNGWKWQIINSFNISEWDYFVEQDQDILDEIGMDIKYIKVKEVSDE